jgi:hypothetical protein
MAVKPWQVTDGRFVGYIDVMGFKDLVSRSTHDQVYKMMLSTEISRRDNATRDWKSGNKRRSGLVKTTSYSDSIVIYSKDGSFEALYSFLCVLAVASRDLFLAGIPHRGAFAYGTMTLDTKNSIFFGQPLIDAYLLEQELAFYGIVGHASAEYKIEAIKNKEDLVYLKRFNCLFKQGSATHLTIYPMHSHPSSNKYSVDDEFIYEQKKLLKAVSDLRAMTSGYLRRYIENTETYLKYLREASFEYDI